MTSVVFIGGGGHAMSCFDACDSASADVVGYVAPEADALPGLAHLGTDAALADIRRRGVRYAFVAVGDNARRRTLSHQAVDLGFELATVVASTARVSPHAIVEPGAAILHGALVGPRARVGTGAVVNTASSVDHDCVIGDFAHIAPGTHLAGNVRIGTGVFAGVGVSVTPEVTVGDWAVVGAGAVVIRNLAPRTTSVGVPARTRRAS